MNFSLLHTIYMYFSFFLFLFLLFEVHYTRNCSCIVQCVYTSYTTVVRAVWDIHRVQEVIRARGL